MVVGSRNNNFKINVCETSNFSNCIVSSKRHATEWLDGLLDGEQAVHNNFFIYWEKIFVLYRDNTFHSFQTMLVKYKESACFISEYKEL